MAKKYDNELKVTIVQLLKSGLTAKQVSKDYDIHTSVIGRWRREYEAKSGDFSKKKELSIEAQ